MRIARLVVAVWFFGISGVTQAGKIYWADSWTRHIRRANLDGTDIETVVSVSITVFPGGPLNVAVDPIRRHIYWTTFDYVGGDEFDSLWRADFDGNQVELFGRQRGASIPNADVAVDAQSGLVYWARGQISCDVIYADPAILVADVDLGVFTELYPVDAEPTGIVVGLPSRSIYWADVGGAGLACQSPPLLRRGLPDGATVVDLVAGRGPNLLYPFGIAVNELAGVLYWVELAIDGSFLVGAVRRARLGDSEHAQKIASATMPEDVAIDVTTGDVFWSDSGTGTITRAGADGSNAHTIIDVGSSGLRGIALAYEPGACCDHTTSDPLETEGVCTDGVLPADCLALADSTWTEGVMCSAITCDARFHAIPAVSEWGLIVQLLLAVIVAEVTFHRRSAAYSAVAAEA